jgi:hypothetical protein
VRVVVEVAGILTGIAAGGPTAYQNIEQAAHKIFVSTAEYVEKYFGVLRKSSVDISHETISI